MDKEWYKYTMEYDSAITKNEILSSATMDGAGGYCTEWNKSEKDKCEVISFKCGIYKAR